MFLALDDFDVFEGEVSVVDWVLQIHDFYLYSLIKSIQPQLRLSAPNIMS
jgi:hypothetical protein